MSAKKVRDKTKGQAIDLIRRTYASLKGTEGEARLKREHLSSLIREAIEGGASYAEVASEIGISRQRVFQIAQIKEDA